MDFEQEIDIRSLCYDRTCRYEKILREVFGVELNGLNCGYPQLVKTCFESELAIKANKKYHKEYQNAKRTGRRNRKDDAG